VKERITSEHLRRLALSISRELGEPVGVDSDGSARYSLIRLSDSHRLVGYLPKRELYNEMHAFRAGVEEARRAYAGAIRRGCIVKNTPTNHDDVIDSRDVIARR
jgi:hypothetical protein